MNPSVQPSFERIVCLACELSSCKHCDRCAENVIAGKHAKDCSFVTARSQGLCTICGTPLDSSIAADRRRGPPVNIPTPNANYCGECRGDLSVGHASTCSQYTGSCLVCNAPKGQCKCGTGEGCAEDAYALERAKEREKEKQTGKAISRGTLCPWCGPLSQAGLFGIPTQYPSRDSREAVIPIPPDMNIRVDIPPATLYPQRKRLPNTRASITRKNACGSHEFYVTVGFYDEEPPARPGEIFVKVAKEGSVLGGMCDALAVTLSLALQYGVPWDSLRDKYLHTRFEPQGASLDNSKQYPSIAHAIADTVDAILAHQKAIWST